MNEAYGMIYLEAQAAGVPVLAQDRPGVRDVLAPAIYPSIDAGAQGFADRLQTLLADASLRRTLGAAAREYVADRHLVPQATARLWAALRPLLKDLP